MGLIGSIKRLPIDLGQANLRGTTKGKLIALEHVSDGEGRRALDIGCREGIQSEWLKAKGYEVTSIDVEKSYPYAIIVDANETLPFEDASYDLIWCSEVIEHLRDPDHFRNEALRLFRPVGRLVLTTPNSYFWFYALARCFGKSAEQLQNPTHLQFFSENDIRRLFPDAKHYVFFPYFLCRCRIKKCLGLLTPTFVVIQDRTRSLAERTACNRVTEPPFSKRSNNSRHKEHHSSVENVPGSHWDFPSSTGIHSGLADTWLQILDPIDLGQPHRFEAAGGNAR